MRPNTWRLSISIRLTCPSTTPEFQGSVRRAMTASRSRSRCWAKFRRLGSRGGRFDPARQLVALQVSDHVAERTHTLGKGEQVGAVGQDGFEHMPQLWSSRRGAVTARSSSSLATKAPARGRVASGPLLDGSQEATSWARTEPRSSVSRTNENSTGSPSRCSTSGHSRRVAPLRSTLGEGSWPSHGSSSVQAPRPISPVLQTEAAAGRCGHSGRSVPDPDSTGSDDLVGGQQLTDLLRAVLGAGAPTSLSLPL